MMLPASIAKMFEANKARKDFERDLAYYLATEAGEYEAWSLAVAEVAQCSQLRAGTEQEQLLLKLRMVAKDNLFIPDMLGIVQPPIGVEFTVRQRYYLLLVYCGAWKIAGALADPKADEAGLMRLRSVVLPRDTSEEIA